MPTQTLFTVQREDLARLDATGSVNLFRQLLWAEARTIGLPTSSVRVSELVNVADGGIDAAVEGGIPEGADLIKEGRTGYQIKASDAFAPWQESEIKKELFGERREPTLENLGSGIKTCLDEGGTYVLVCFKQDPVDRQHEQCVNHLKNVLSQCGYDNPNVAVWGQSTLIGFLERYPSLALDVNGRGHHRYQTHKSWLQNADMQRQFEAGDEQRELISRLQDELQSPNDGAIHVRVGGEPGIGKTRLILEATSDDTLQPLVLYFHKPELFSDSELMGELLSDDNVFSTILVVDECDPDSTTYIWNRLKHRGPNIKFISIYGQDPPWGGTPYFQLESLGREQISRILAGYGMPKDQADRWIDMCDGSPRVAHVVGWNLKNNPEDLLKPPDTVSIWDRYVCGDDDPRSDRVQQRRLVLQHIALFKRFGFEPPVA